VDNFPHLGSQQGTRLAKPVQLLVVRLPSRNEQDAADFEKWNPQLGHDGQGSKGPCCGDIEPFSSGLTAKVLETCMDNAHICDLQTGGHRRYPIQSPPLGIHQREPRPVVHRRKRQARKPGSRPKVDPVLASLWSSNGRQAERIVNMALPQTSALMGAEKPSLDSLEIRILKLAERGFGPCVEHRRNTGPSMGIGPS